MSACSGCRHVYQENLEFWKSIESKSNEICGHRKLPPSATACLEMGHLAAQMETYNGSSISGERQESEYDKKGMEECQITLERSKEYTQGMDRDTLNCKEGKRVDSGKRETEESMITPESTFVRPASEVKRGVSSLSLPGIRDRERMAAKWTSKLKHDSVNKHATNVLDWSGSLNEKKMVYKANLKRDEDRYRVGDLIHKQGGGDRESQFATYLERFSSDPTPDQGVDRVSLTTITPDGNNRTCLDMHAFSPMSSDGEMSSFQKERLCELDNRHRIQNESEVGQIIPIKLYNATLPETDKVQEEKACTVDDEDNETTEITGNNSVVKIDSDKAIWECKTFEYSAETDDTNKPNGETLQMAQSVEVTASYEYQEHHVNLQLNKKIFYIGDCPEGPIKEDETTQTKVRRADMNDESPAETWRMSLQKPSTYFTVSDHGGEESESEVLNVSKDCEVEGDQGEFELCPERLEDIGTCFRETVLNQPPAVDKPSRRVPLSTTARIVISITSLVICCLLYYFLADASRMTNLLVYMDEALHPRPEPHAVEEEPNWLWGAFEYLLPEYSKSGCGC